ncbi:hypothetical protein QLX52_26895 [Streptomyces albus]|uniref:hypothetical protein n=1 Tax=Streptomyces albus TaxID=1888 RepID=UPI0024AD1DEC|nr:hypothetical protein [Streptomyces albus]MDI6412432.1 hypothetical protein [Streptomyces albus]
MHPVPPAQPPARPTPVGLFLARTFKGDWLGALRVAVWPLGLLFVAACALGIWSNDDIDDLDIGWGTRMRVALAALLQGVGGGFGVSSDGTSSVGGERVVGEAEFSGLPLLATAVWLGALVLAARAERRRSVRATRSAGFEAALRIGLVCGLGGLVLGLYAAPSYEGLELDSAPGLTLLWAFLSATLVAALVLARAETDAWLAARPGNGPRIVAGALRTAALALVAVVTLASFVTFTAVLLAGDDVKASDVWVLLAMLPNLGAFGLAFAWGAPLDAEWNVSEWSSGRESLGYSDLADASGAWAVTGTLLGGLACALLLGWLVARRSPTRAEQLLAAAFFAVGVLVLVALAGLGFEAAFHGVSGGPDGGGLGDYPGDYSDGLGDVTTSDSFASSARIAAGAAELLLFALLWSFGGALLVPLLRASFGKGGPGGLGPAAWGAGGAAGAWAYGHAAYGQAPYGPSGYPPAAYGQPPHGPGGAHPSAGPGTAPGVHDQGAFGPPPPAAGPTGDAPDATVTDAGTAGPGTPHDSTPGTPGSPGTPGTPDAPGTPGGGGPVPPPQRRRGLMWAGLVLAAFLVGGAAVGGAVYLAGGDGRDGRDKGKPAAGESVRPKERVDGPATDRPSDREPAGPRPAPSAGADGEEGPGGSPTAPRSTDLPDGFTMADDPKGFSVGVMEGWQREPKGSQTDYAAPTGGDYLRIGVIENAGQSSLDNFRTLEKGARKRDGYRRLELTENTFRGRPGARWEFVYTSDESGRTIHAVDQAYVAEDGTEYSLYFECRYDEWDPAADQVFSTALRTWDEDGR